MYSERNRYEWLAVQCLLVKTMGQRVTINRKLTQPHLVKEEHGLTEEVKNLFGLGSQPVV
jgi:hypothetical protein